METTIALQKRSNYRLYDLNNYPSKETIREILEAALDHSPIKNGVCHFQIDIHGPEYHEDKLRLCHTSLTSFDEYASIIPWGTEEDFSIIREMLEDCIENGDHAPFNIQLLAPWLLTFRRFEDPRKPYSDTVDDARVNTYVNLGCIAQSISLIANDMGVHSTFCNCWEQCPNYQNKITKEHSVDMGVKTVVLEENTVVDSGEIVFFMGLGYKRSTPDGAEIVPSIKQINGIEHKEHVLVWK